MSSLCFSPPEKLVCDQMFDFCVACVVAPKTQNHDDIAQPQLCGKRAEKARN